MASLLGAWCAVAGVTAPMTAVAADGPAPSTADSACVTPEQLGIVMIVDDSGSNSVTDVSNLRGEAAAIAIDQVTTGTIVATSLFESVARRLSPPVAIDDQSRATQRTLVRDALMSFGGTSYQSAFVEAQEQLAGMPTTVDRRAVIFLSDGEPVGSYDADGPIAAAGTPIYTIGFGGADMSELAGIAARSGGQHWTAADAVSLQHVFGNITAILGCAAQNITDDLTLAPGTSQAVPFTVGACEDELRALASWREGDVAVHLERPDGTRLDADHSEAWERFIAEATYVSANSTQPASGGWSLVLTASAQNLMNVDVTINVWGRECPADPEPTDPDPITPDPIAPPPTDPAPTPPAPTIAAPTNCVAVATSHGAKSSVEFSWVAASADSMFTSYEVQTTHKGTANWVGHAPTTSTSMTIAGHNPGSSWSYRVRSTSIDGRTSDWCTVTVTVPVWSLQKQGTIGPDVFVGSAGPDLLAGKGGNDKLDGRGGNDTLHGGIGNDWLSGGAGNDKLDGAAGRDQVHGGAGNDQIKVQDKVGNDIVSCGPGKDKVIADARDIVRRDCEKVVRV